MIWTEWDSVETTTSFVEDKDTQFDELRKMGIPAINVELYCAYWEIAALKRENEALRVENEKLKAPSTKRRPDVLHDCLNTMKRICQRDNK